MKPKHSPSNADLNTFLNTLAILCRYEHEEILTSRVADAEGDLFYAFAFAFRVDANVPFLKSDGSVSNVSDTLVRTIDIDWLVKPNGSVIQRRIIVCGFEAKSVDEAERLMREQLRDSAVRLASDGLGTLPK